MALWISPKKNNLELSTWPVVNEMENGYCKFYTALTQYWFRRDDIFLGKYYANGKTSLRWFEIGIKFSIVPLELRCEWENSKSTNCLKL